MLYTARSRFFAVLALNLCVLSASGQKDGLVSAIVETAAGVVEVSSFSSGSLRITRGNKVSPELVFVEKSDGGEFRGRRPVFVNVEKREGETQVSSGALSATVSHRTGLVRFEKSGAGTILEERESGAKHVVFDSPENERLFGLGQFQDGALDIRSFPRSLVQVNTQISIPFLVSTRGWGLYWHTYSKVLFNPCKKRIPLVAEAPAGGGAAVRTVEVTTSSGGARESRREIAYTGAFETDKAGEYAFFFESGRSMARQQVVEIDGERVVENRNFWLPTGVGFKKRLPAGRHEARILAESRDEPALSMRKCAGETRFETESPLDGTDYVVYCGAPEEAISHFRADTGGTAALPDWAWGYWHCQERFKTQAELLAALRWFKERDLPLSVIVQDWLWWRPGTWNSMEWDEKRFPDPKGMAAECRAAGVRTMLSVWSKTAGESAFRSEMESAGGFVPGTEWIDFSKKEAADVYWKWFAKNCVSTGIDSWWLDAVEPENDDLHGRRLAMGDGDVYRNIYPLLVNMEADRRLRALRPGETPLVLTRCAFAGQQRHPCVMWSGDVGSGWDDLRKQIIAGLGFAAAAMPYWTSDAGGFFRPRGQYGDAAYRKRLVRWLQFATFCPVQRVHGYNTDSTPSRFGPETEKLICDQIRLRKRLEPYIKRTAKAAAERNAMIMRPLWDAPEGFETQYMFGQDILVCPVTSDAAAIDVWLPAGEWRDFHTGEPAAGGRVVRMETRMDRIPVFVKAGAVL